MKYSVPSILCFFFFTSVGLAQEQFSNNQTKEDLTFLINGIKQYNPALAVYNPNFNSQSDQILSSVEDDSISIIEYFKYVSHIVTNSNEGHFGLGRWTDVAHKGFTENQYKYLPFSVKLIKGKIFIWSDFSEENVLSKGSELLSINDISSSTILEKLYTYIPSDGNIISNLERKAEAGFPWMYYLYIEQPENFVIKLKEPTGVKEVNIKPLTIDQRNENYSARYAVNTQPVDPSINDLYTFKVERNYAMLKLKSFDYRLIDQYNVKAEKLYNSFFEELATKKISTLLIDLRNNTGGRNEFADEFVPFLNQHRKDEFLKKTISWEGKERLYKFPKKHKYAFAGKIFLLVNGNTYSAGATLARYLKEYGNAIVVGEETGTRYEGFVAGSSQEITLPHSKIIIGVPRYHILFPRSSLQKTTNRGLLPDHVVIESIESAILNEDIQLEFVKALIQQDSK